jgi:hypothetical protein
LPYCTKEIIETVNDDGTTCLELACEGNAPIEIISVLAKPSIINLRNKKIKPRFILHIK